MEELGFIRYNNGIIEKAAIKRCSLEDAPLYVTLQQERERLEHIYKENYRLSQHELLQLLMKCRWGVGRMPSTNAITNITDIDELFARIEEYLAPEQVAFVRKAYGACSQGARCADT